MSFFRNIKSFYLGSLQNGVSVISHTFVPKSEVMADIKAEYYRMGPSAFQGSGNRLAIKKSPGLQIKCRSGLWLFFGFYSTFPPNSLYDTFSGFHLSFGVGLSAGWPMTMVQRGIMVSGSFSDLEIEATRSSMG